MKKNSDKQELKSVMVGKSNMLGCQCSVRRIVHISLMVDLAVGGSNESSTEMDVLHVA
jgi:hypothetical protein